MLYTLYNGKTFTDQAQSDLFERLLDLRPHESFDYSWDDLGMSNLMCEVYGDKICYCPQNRLWYIRDNPNSTWQKTPDIGAVNDMLETLLNLLLVYCGELKHAPDATGEQKKTLDQYHKYLGSTRRYNSMQSILKTLAIKRRLNLADFDSNPYLLKTTNQAYNLLTGEHISDISPYNVTLSSPSRLPDWNTTVCTRWYDFIDEIMSHDKEKAAFLQRALGYSLLGINKEECMFIAYGQKSRNGKGTLFSTIERALGSDYCATVSPNLICETPRGTSPDFNSPQPILASLVGKRIVSMPEAQRGVKLDAAAMKSLTGRDALTTRGLYEGPFTFTPQFTLWLNTNYLPAVNDEVVFQSDRVWVITFDEHFDETKRDINLKEYFTTDENLRTVLKWLLDGANEYAKQGLNPPQKVRQATHFYHLNSDVVGQFLRDQCRLNPNDYTKRGDLYTAYRNWCNSAENRFKPYGSKTFYSILEQHGLKIERVSNDYCVIGVRVE